MPLSSAAVRPGWRPQLRFAGAGARTSSSTGFELGGIPRHTDHSGTACGVPPHPARSRLRGPGYPGLRAGADLRPATTVTGWADGDGAAGRG